MAYVILILAVCGAVWVVRKVLELGADSGAQREPVAVATDTTRERRRQREAKRRETMRQLNRKARALQLALLQLPQAPDFRRAASFAAQAREVPAAFRQRQFRRFRSLLARHFAMRLRAGTDAAVLLSSLRQLLGHLSIPAYEADYIHDGAQAALARPALPQRQPTYAERLVELQRDHVQRAEALRRLDTLDPDTREQMLEAEMTRFRQALQECGAAPDASPAP